MPVSEADWHFFFMGILRRFRINDSGISAQSLSTK